MNHNLHTVHTFSILTTAPSFIYHKLKEQKSILQTFNFTTHLLETGTNIRYMQQLLGYLSNKTNMIYTHVSNNAVTRIQNPLDRLITNTEIKKDDKNEKKCNNFVLLHSWAQGYETEKPTAFHIFGRRFKN